MLLKINSSSPPFSSFFGVNILQHIFQKTTHQKPAIKFHPASSLHQSDGYAPKSQVSAPIIFQHLQVGELLQPLFWGGTGTTAFCVMACQGHCQGEKSSSEMKMIRSMKICFFLKLLSEKLLVVQLPIVTTKSFSTVMDDSVRMPNFQKTFFWSVSSENGI